MNSYVKKLKESLIGDEDNVEYTMNVAAGVIYKKDENDRTCVLLIQRAADDHWPNHWEFPRGKCDKPIGESLLSCVKREIKEETGLDVKPVTLIDTFEYLADEGKRKSICHNFLCEMINPNQKIKLSKEHQNYQWITEAGEAEMMLLPDQKRTALKILSNENPIISIPKNDFTSNNKLEEYLQWLTKKMS